MKSTNGRLRAKLGKTDYYHRKKMISNYPNITRIVFGKKLNYHYVGLYNTISPDQPDECLYYVDSRMIKECGTSSSKKSNTETIFYLGKLVAPQLDNLKINSMLVLDLGRRKHIVYKPFLFGLLTGSSPTVQDKLKHGFSMDQVQEYADTHCKEYEFIKK